MTFSSYPLPPTDPQTQRASTVRIQPAKTEELALVADVMSQVFNPPVGVQGFFFPLYRLTVSADLHKRMRSDPRHYCCLGAWWGATMVGALEISLRDLSGVPQAGLHPYVSNLAVLPQWRRRGVAQQLLIGAEAVALAWGYQALHLHVLESNPAARHLYEKMEYRVLHVSSDLWQWLGASRQFLLYRRLGCDPVSRADPAR